MNAGEPLPITGRTRIRRLPERQVTRRQALYEVLDAGLVAHVATTRDGIPVVLPFAYARHGDDLLLHGSTGGGLLREAVGGAPLAVAVTLLDGLVYARSLFDSSMNYRSAMILGTARPLTGDKALAALRHLSEHLMPGRWAEVRPPTRRELAATLVLSMPLAEASVKVRAEGVTPDPRQGTKNTGWAGVLPLTLCAGEPEPDPDNPPGLDMPLSITTAVARHRPMPRRETRPHSPASG